MQLIGLGYYIFIAIAILSAIMFFIEKSQDKEKQRTVFIAIAFILMVTAGLFAYVFHKASEEADVGYAGFDYLEDGQVYYLNATIQSPDNPQLISIVILKADTITGNLNGPIILINSLPKERFAQGVEPGKYIKKNAQGQIETWVAPIRN